MIAHRPCRFVWGEFPEFFRGLGRLRWHLAREAAAGACEHRVAGRKLLVDRVRGDAPEPSALERTTDLTRCVVRVPKADLPKPTRERRPRQPSRKP